jgi:formylglycine-generating enzyme required for sulfatase activity
VPEGTKIFLAHAFEDKKSVRKLYVQLKEQGHQPWLDEEDLLPGQNWRIEIPKAIRECDFFIACLSEHAIQKQGYMHKEFRVALDVYAEKPPGSIYLIPLKFDDCEVPDIQLPQHGTNLRDIHWLDYWKPDGLARLLKVINKEQENREIAPEHKQIVPPVEADEEHSQLNAAKKGGASTLRSMPSWVLIVSVVSALVCIAVLLMLAEFTPQPSTSQVFVLRIVLALAVAVFCATIPGFLKLKLSFATKCLIHAGGAIVLFILIYQFNPLQLITPDQIPDQTPDQLPDQISDQTSDKIITRKLSGTILDQNSNPLAKVLVTLPEMGKKTVTNKQGFFSFELDMEKGTMLRLAARKEKFIPYRQDVPVGSTGHTFTLKRSPPKIVRTLLSVKSNVSDAKVFLNNRYLGATELSKIEIPAGKKQVRIEKEGYIPYTKEIEFEKGSKNLLTVTLELKPPAKGSLSVRTYPENAVVKILNIKSKFYQGIKLAPGSYHLQVFADGWETQTLKVKINAGEDKTITLNLRRIIPEVPKSKVKVTKKKAVNTSQQSSSQSTHKEKIAPGENWKDPLTGIEFVWIPKGSFKMGCVSESKECNDDEMFVHEVNVDGFWMGKYEVTLFQFDQFITSTGYKTDAEKKKEEKSGCWSMVEEYGQRHWDWKKGADWRSPGYSQLKDMPVVCVSWNDVHIFIRWISEKSGESFRLPTEAEWEYACRAGSSSSRFWGDDPDNACHYANVTDRTKDGQWKQGTEIHKCSDGHYHVASVGGFEPNRFGLYDMLGNVWEWCEDVYASDAYSKHARKNPLNKKGSALRVIRGGCRLVKPEFVRSAGRYSHMPDGHYGNLGFRLVKLR